MIPSRKETVELIYKQLDMETSAAKNKSHHHYGKAELRELLDFIYGGPPENEEEFI